jgi:hypothetical protein
MLLQLTGAQVKKYLKQLLNKRPNNGIVVITGVVHFQQLANGLSFTNVVELMFCKMFYIYTDNK